MDKKYIPSEKINRDLDESLGINKKTRLITAIIFILCLIALIIQPVLEPVGKAIIEKIF